MSFYPDGASSKIEWGKYYDDRYGISKHVVASGQMNGTGKDYFQLNFIDIQCSDEGIYECVYVGYNVNGELLKSSMKGELIVYCKA